MTKGTESPVSDWTTNLLLFCHDLSLYQTDATSEAAKWAQLGALVKEIASSGLVDTSILLTSLELNLLVAAGLAKDETAHQKRFIRINTNMVFKQQKYNLLREETEGYSKLSVMLCNEMPQSSHDMSDADLTAATALFVTNVFSVVGHFDLEVCGTIAVVVHLSPENS